MERILKMAATGGHLKKTSVDISSQLRGFRQRMPVGSRRIGRGIDLHPHILDFRAAGRTNSAEIEIGRHVNSVERLLAAVDQVSASEIRPA